MVAVPISCFDTMVGLLVDRSSCKSIPSQNAIFTPFTSFYFSADTRRAFWEKVPFSAVFDKIYDRAIWYTSCIWIKRDAYFQRLLCDRHHIKYFSVIFVYIVTACTIMIMCCSMSCVSDRKISTTDFPYLSMLLQIGWL